MTNNLIQFPISKLTAVRGNDANSIAKRALDSAKRDMMEELIIQFPSDDVDE